MPRVKTTPSKIKKIPILAGVQSKETMPVTKELKRCSNLSVDHSLSKHASALTEAPKRALASQESPKGSALKTHLFRMHTGDDFSLEQPVRAGWGRDRIQVANSGGNRPDSRIYDINLRRHNFTSKNLTSCQYQSVDFLGSDFRGADLSGATFKDTNLSQCNFRGAVLTDLCCEGVLFIGARVGGTMIESGHYSGCNFAWAELTDVACVGVNLSGNDFSSAKLIKVVLDCDLSGANLTNLDLDEVDFSGANLTNAQISLSQRFIDKTLLGPIPSDSDYCPGTGIRNLLATIHSINPTYQNLKNSLMRSVIEQLSRLDDVALQRHLPALVEMLFNNPGYDEVPEIASFNNRLLILWLEENEQEPCHHGEIDWDLVLDLVNRHPSGKEHLVSKYGKTLTLLGGRALSDAQTASLQPPAITTGTAQN